MTVELSVREKAINSSFRVLLMRNSGYLGLYPRDCNCQSPEHYGTCYHLSIDNVQFAPSFQEFNETMIVLYHYRSTVKGRQTNELNALTAC